MSKTQVPIRTHLLRETTDVNGRLRYFLDGKRISANKAKDIITTLQENFKKECHVCKGTKLATITVVTHKTDDQGNYVRKENKSEMDCYVCDGKGYLTQKDETFWKNYEEAWCKCEKSKNAYHCKKASSEYGNDTYLCGICHKVVQFG